MSSSSSSLACFRLLASSLLIPKKRSVRWFGYSHQAYNQPSPLSIKSNHSILDSSSSSSLPSTSSSPSSNKNFLNDLPVSITKTLDSIVDPFQLLANELTPIKQNIKALIGSNHSLLDSIAKYYFSSPNQGKHLRPLVILLISQATANSSAIIDLNLPLPSINQPISRAEILNDSNPSQPLSSNSIDRNTKILPTQRRLAEIAELIHVSSLLHDDVIDQAETRRGRPSSPRVFGSKLSVLAGDFLLARASVALARLGNIEVVELISTIISNLVEGELMQLRSQESTNSVTPTARSTNDNNHQVATPSIYRFDERLFELYERKNYLKTASLIAKTCRAAVILSPFSNRNSTLVESCYEFGKHLGLAFQIVDDILDYTSTEEALGKTSDSSDLKSGLITAPGLFAWQSYGDEFGQLANRRFSNNGDLDLALMMIKESNGIEKSYQLAKDHLSICHEHLDRSKEFLEPQARQGLDRLCDLILERTH